MANINVKGFMMLAVGLIVSTILVTGVLVPVIGNAIEGDEATYTNTGEYYYSQAKEGENRTLSVTETDDSVIITCDGVAAHTITKGLDGWSIPLFACKDARDHTYLFSIYYYVEFDTSANNIVKKTDINAPCLDFDGTDYNTVPVTYNINGKSVSDGEGNISDDLMFYLTNTGDYVLSESPVVAEDQMIYTSDMFQTYDPSSDPKTIKYVSIAGSGTIETIGTGKISSGSGNGIFIPSAFYDWETYNSTTGQYIGWFDCQSSYGWEEGDVVTHTTSTPNGTKLDDISLTIRWENTDNPTQNVELTKFIVPVTVGIEGSGGLSPSMTAVLSLVPFLIIIGITLVTIDHMIKKE